VFKDQAGSGKDFKATPELLTRSKRTRGTAPTYSPGSGLEVNPAWREKIFRIGGVSKKPPIFSLLSSMNF
jgi:hypothetical protein